jgi:hypothetical protein
MPADRADLEARQAAFLSALIGGADPPAGFDPEQARATARALLAKRARTVRAAWPALTEDLGEEFSARFEAYARAGEGPPVHGGAVADGLAFARTLGRRREDAVRVEVLFARALVSPRPFLGAIQLREPRRLLVVARSRRGDPRHLALPLGRR